MSDTILSYPEVPSMQVPAQKLVVLLHGLGSDGHDLIDLVQFMQPNLPDCHFISPHGVEEFDMAPFGRQWFSLNDRNPETIAKLAKQSSDMLTKIIELKQNELSLSNKDTIIIGFSQGTMIGLFHSLVQQEPFLGMVGFSGRLIAPSLCNNTKTPICLIHGMEDDIVAFEEMEVISKYLSSHKIKHYSHPIANLAHSIDGQAIRCAVDFLKMLD